MSQPTLLLICFNSSKLINPTRLTSVLQPDRHLPNPAASYSLNPILRSSSGGQVSLTRKQPQLVNGSSSSSSLSRLADPSTSSPGLDQKIIQASKPCGDQTVECHAGPSRQIHTKLLLQELQLIQNSLKHSNRPEINNRVDFLWERWKSCLQTQGKKPKPNEIYHINHKFAFLSPSKLPQVLEDALDSQHKRSSSIVLKDSIGFDPRIFKSIGSAALKHQNWTVLKKLLSCQTNLNQEDLLTIVKLASKKILFSPDLKTQAARIDIITELMEVITETFNEETDCGKCMSQIIEILCDALLRMSRHHSATTAVLGILRRRPSFSNFFCQDFLHRLMRTCASHQDLSLAQELLSELPTDLQTLNQYKACLSAWDRRTLRPLLHSTCSVWDALVSHPLLTPDHESYNLYLLVKSKLGHVEDLIRIISSMERRGGLLNDEGKQKTYGILLHSVGRRKGLQTAYKMLPELVSKGYKPDEYTSNILLSARHPMKNSDSKSKDFQNRTKSNPDKETKLLETIDLIKKANMKSDEVTRNIIIRSFLSRAHHHSKDDILDLKSVALDRSDPATGLDRNQFRRFRRPLYSMLCEALRRADCQDELARLQHEWKHESLKARLKSNPIQILPPKNDIG